MTLLRCFVGYIFSGYLCLGAVVVAANRSKLAFPPRDTGIEGIWSNLLQSAPCCQQGEYQDFVLRLDNAMNLVNWDCPLARVPLGNSYVEILANLLLWQQIAEEVWVKNDKRIAEWTRTTYSRRLPGFDASMLLTQQTSCLGFSPLVEIGLLMRRIPKAWEIWWCQEWRDNVRRRIKSSLYLNSKALTADDLTFNFDEQICYNDRQKWAMVMAGIDGFIEQVKWGFLTTVCGSCQLKMQPLRS